MSNEKIGGGLKRNDFSSDETKPAFEKAVLRLLKSVFYFSVNSLDFGLHPLLDQRQKI